MHNMPGWYKLTRSAILLLQSVIGVLLVSYPLKKKAKHLLRLLIGTAIGCVFMSLIGCQIYVPGSSAPAVLSHTYTSWHGTLPSWP